MTPTTTDTSKKETEKLMPWIRENDVLERINAPGGENDFLCLLREKYKFIISVDDDTSVRFLHDLKDLVDKFLVGDGAGVGVELGSKSHLPRVLETVLADVLAPGHEQRGIDGEIRIIFRVEGAERDVKAIVESNLGGLDDHSQIGVVDTEPVLASHEPNSENSHELDDTAPGTPPPANRISGGPERRSINVIINRREVLQDGTVVHDGDVILAGRRYAVLRLHYPRGRETNWHFVRSRFGWPIHQGTIRERVVEKFDAALASMVDLTAA